MATIKPQYTAGKLESVHFPPSLQLVLGCALIRVPSLFLCYASGYTATIIVTVLF